MRRHNPHDALTYPFGSSLAGEDATHLPVVGAARTSIVGAATADRDPAAIGVLADLAAIMIAAAAAIGVFFGIAVILLQPPTQPLSRATSETTIAGSQMPALRLAEPAQRTATPDGPVGAPGFAGSAAARPVPAIAAESTPKVAAAITAAIGAAGRKAHASAPSPGARADIGAANLVARGDAFLRAGDIASARLFYERAADSGDGRAALRAGATFDPLFLAGIRPPGMRGDRAKAIFWYRRAIGLGAGDAELYLHRLETK